MMRQMLSRASLLFAIASSGGALADCGNEAGKMATITELQGKWVLESIGGRPVDTEREVYFELTDRTLTGFDGCNRFGGSLDRPEAFRRTQRACPEDAVSLPLDLTDPLPQLESSKLAGETLELVLSGDRGTALLRRQSGD